MITLFFIRRSVLGLVLLGLASFVVAATQRSHEPETPIIPGTPWHVHDVSRPQPPVVTPGAHFSEQAAPPSDAIVLFDGKDLDQWQEANGKPARWTIENGYLQIAPHTGNIRSRRRFPDFQLHLEFATPSPATGRDQGRGNSGVLINGEYEVQVLDSYKSKTYADGQCGALYGQSPPLVNACRPPGEWQTYDITFEAPHWDAAGRLIKKAAVTVLQNGIVIHNHREFIGHTDGIGGVPWKSLGNYGKPESPEMFIELQNHGSSDRYRNIWIRPLGQYDRG
jgi:hypothetical protein